MVMLTRVLFFSFFLVGAMGVNAQPVNQTNYYVVIGAFTKLMDAQKLTDEANIKTFHAHYALHIKRKRYYVYLLETPDQKKAKSFLAQIRKETEYKKAYLYTGKFEEEKN